MVQTRLEEKMESYDQEIQSIKKEMSKIPIIEKTLTEISKNMEKHNQMMLRFMESAAQERSTMNERITELSIRGTPMKNNDDGDELPFAKTN